MVRFFFKMFQTDIYTIHDGYIEYLSMKTQNGLLEHGKDFGIATAFYQV